jgi:tripartite-type tricarboxylate transporter receptor subunit TctC
VGSILRRPHSMQHPHAKAALDRRQFLSYSALAAAGAAGWPQGARADDWKPTRPVTIYVPSPGGGATDVHARFLADRVSRTLGQPFIIEGRPGAATTLSGAAVANAKPDGHSLAIILPNSYRMPHMQATPWNPLRDFEYVCGIALYTFGVLAHKDSAWKSIDEAIAAAKAAPGKYTIGTAGNGTTGHLVLIELERITGAKFLHVPYKGMSDTSRALMAKDVDFILEAGSVVQNAFQGMYKLLAIADEEPSPALPGIPTLRQKGWDAVAWSSYGLVTRKGTPAAAVQALNAAFTAAMEAPEHEAMLDKLVTRRWKLGPREYQAWAEKYYHDMKPVLVRAGLAVA